MRLATVSKATPATADSIQLLKAKSIAKCDVAALRRRLEAPARVQMLERPFDMFGSDGARHAVELDRLV